MFCELFADVERLVFLGKVMRADFTRTEYPGEGMSVSGSVNPGDREAAANSDAYSYPQFRVESLARVLKSVDRALENAGFLDLLQDVEMGYHRSAAKTVEVAVGLHDGVRDRRIEFVHPVAEVAQSQPRGDRLKILNARDHANEFDLAAPLIRGTECIAPYVWTKSVQKPGAFRRFSKNIWLT